MALPSSHLYEWSLATDPAGIAAGVKRASRTPAWYQEGDRTSAHQVSPAAPVDTSKEVHSRSESE